MSILHSLQFLHNKGLKLLEGAFLHVSHFWGQKSFAYHFIDFCS